MEYRSTDITFINFKHVNICLYSCTPTLLYSLKFYTSVLLKIKCNSFIPLIL